jgi:PAS domain S-box-containing protein
MVSRRKLAAEAAPPLTSGIEEQTVAAAAGRASRTRRPRVTWITTVPSLVHSIDETGLIVAVSNKWLEKLGYRRDEVVGRKVWDFYSEESRRRSRDVYLPEFLETGVADNRGYEMICKSGQTIDVLVSGILNPERVPGQGRHAIAVVTDISALKIAERQLRDNEERFRTLVEDQIEMISVAKPDGELLFVNQAYARFHGVPAEGLVGRNLLDMMPADGRAAKAAYLRDVAASDLPLETESQTVTGPDGEIRWFAWINRAIHNRNGGTVIHSAGRDITQRKLAEAASHQSNLQFHRAFEASPHGMSLVSLEGRFVVTNRALCAMLGYSADEFLTLDIQAVTHPDDIEASLANMEALRGGHHDNYQLEKRYRHKDASTVNALLSVSLVRALDGTPLHFLAQMQDLGPLKGAEAKLKLIVDSVASGVLVADENGRIETASIVAERLFGYPPDGMIGLAVEELVPSARREAHKGHRAAYLRDPQVRSMARGVPLSGVRYDGSVFPIEVSLSPIAGPDGFRIVASVNDITTRMTMEVVQARLAAIVESSADAIIAQTIDGTITNWNPAAERLLGYSASEIIGQSIDRILPPKQSPEERACKDAVASGITVPPIDTIRLHKDGSRIDVSLALSPMLDERGRVVGISKIARDIRARKQLDTALLHAKALAEQAADSKGEFLANMSHEIRTPMNAVLGLAQLLARTRLNDEQRDYLTKISAAGRTLLGILNDILDSAKIEANCLELETINFQPGLVFEDLSSIMSITGAVKNIELAVSIDPAIPREVIGDPSRLQQVLINLAGNAIKFTERGAVLVRAELIAREQGVVRVRFTVKDSGIGMTVTQQARLFQPFSQADASTTRRFGGTGLGLAICKRLVDLMGGTIEVTSEPGTGSTFCFTIPFGEAVATLPPVVPSALSILAADDNPIARQALAQNIGAIGWQSEIVTCGEDMLACLRAAPDDHYDVLLVDWQMPDLDGPEICRRIRQNLPARRPLILAMVSAFARDDALRFRVDGDVDAVVGKPITPSILHDAVIKASASRKWDGNGAPPRSLGWIPRLAGVRVLLVEDNIINQQVALAVLQEEGSAVTVVANGQDSVDWLRLHRNGADIVLMDLQMPVMDGVEAATLIRAQLTERELPIIALSAAVFQSDRDRCLQAGMNSFLAKPIEVEKLVETIRRLVKPRRQPLSPADGVWARPADAAPSTLAGIPGLDLEQARLRLGGNESLLLSMLLQLSDSIAELGQNLRQDLAAEDRKRASNRLHTLRGSAASIGVTGLAAMAGDIEADLRSGHLINMRKVDALEAAASSFRSAMSCIVTPPAQGEGDPMALNDIEISRLIAQLNEGDLGVLDLYAMLSPALRVALPAPVFERLSRGIEQLDFPRASETLEFWKAHST